MYPQIPDIASPKNFPKGAECLQIDDEIRQLEARLVQLKLRRNALSPICQLPAEILSSIFAFVRVCDPWLFEGQSYFWIPSVTHVCSLWRNVALQSSFLWDIMTYDGDFLNQVIFSRSKPEMPLTLYHRMDSLETRRRRSDLRKLGALGTAIVHLHRIRELELVVNKNQVSHLFQITAHLRTSAAHNLQKCVIGATRNREGNSFELQNGTFQMWPQLHYLKLQEAKFSWEELGCLTMLKTLIVVSPKSRLNRQNLAGVLNQLPTLEVLELSRCLPTRNADSSHRVNLPFLQRLKIYDEAQRCTAILDLLESLPPGLVVELYLLHASIIDAPLYKNFVKWFWDSKIAQGLPLDHLSILDDTTDNPNHFILEFDNPSPHRQPRRYIDLKMMFYNPSFTTNPNHRAEIAFEVLSSLGSFNGLSVFRTEIPLRVEHWRLLGLAEDLAALTCYVSISESDTLLQVLDGRISESNFQTLEGESTLKPGDPSSFLSVSAFELGRFRGGIRVEDRARLLAYWRARDAMGRRCRDVRLFWDDDARVPSRFRKILGKYIDRVDILIDDDAQVAGADSDHLYTKSDLEECALG